MAATGTSVSTLRIGNGAEPESLDPHRATGVSAGNVLRDLFEGLTGYSARGQLQPAAAGAWTIAADGLTYTFQLRSGLRWSDGSPLTAVDFAAGLRRAVAPATASGYAELFGVILHAPEVIAGRMPPDALGVEAADPQTLVIRLRVPAPQLPAILAHPAASPVHHSVLEVPSRSGASDFAVIGNGAYRLVEWNRQSQIVLLRNSYYWNDRRTSIERVVYVPTEDVNSELKRYRAGELDITSAVPASQMPWIRQNAAAELRLAPYYGSYFYGYNLTRPPFAGNPALRQALSMAVDRELIATKVLQGLATPAWSLVPPGADEVRKAKPRSTMEIDRPALDDSLSASAARAVAPDWAHWPQHRMLAEARRLYAAAGYTAAQPLEVEIRYNTQDDHKRIAVVIAAMWKQNLGVRVRLVNEEWKVFLQNRRERRVTQAFRNTWIGDYEDPASFLQLFASGHSRNDSGYASSRYDELLSNAEREGDPQQRREHQSRAEQLLLEDAAILPIYFYRSKHLVKPHVAGWQDNPLDWHATKDLSLH